MRALWRAICVLMGCGVLAGGGAALGQTMPFRDTALPFDKRVADLVGRLTLEQKAAQIMASVPANTDLNIPAVEWWTEAIHGVARAGNATQFPEAIGMAAAWDPPLMKQVGDAIAVEARAKLILSGRRYFGIILWAPTINMARDPRWGRLEETYGEDPYLTGRLAVDFIQGLQGDDPKYLKTVATPKHFAMHSQETGRINHSFDCPEEVLRDYYLPAFRDSFVEGKAASTMAAFSGINKIPATANFWLLTDLLRREWGFDGAVVTDWSAVTQLVNAQQYVTNLKQGVAAAINAGVDVICDANAAGIQTAIRDAVNEKSLKMEMLDRAVSRNLMLRFRLGMFDPPEMVPLAMLTKSPGTAVGSKENLAVALKAALESVVLLKNDPAPRGFGLDKLLPLDLKRIDSIAVLGPYANSNQFGAYPGTPANAAPTILAALRTAVGERVTVRPESNTVVVVDPDSSVKMAQQSSVVIFVCGLNNQIEKEGIDRASLRLPDDQMTLLQKVVKANPLTVVLVEGGSPVALAAIRDLVPALMVIWYPGEQGGVALTKLLLGQANPSGKLPLTYYRANDDLPPLDDYDIRKGRTYMYLTKPPTYVFGAGISYTSYAYRNIQVTPKEVAADGTITVTLEVVNSGKMDGDEIVQLYFHVKGAAANLRPIKQLKRFARVGVPAGQSRPVTFTVPVAELGYWDVAAKKYVPDKGVYEFMVGASSEDIRGRGEVTVK